MKPFQTVIDGIRVLAEESPEKKAACNYFDSVTDSPCCIFGHLLADFGVEAPIDYDRRYVEPLVLGDEEIGREGANAADIKWAKLGFEAPTGKEETWIVTVQAEQDHGKTWSQAVAIADGLE